MQTLRFARADIAARYPLPITDRVDWSNVHGTYVFELPLPALADGAIVVPSLSLGSLDYAFETSLRHDGAEWLLAPIGCPHRTIAVPNDRVQTHIDYFSIHGAVEGARLRFAVFGPRAPERYLLAVSIRAARIEPVGGCVTSARLAVPPITQLLAPRAVRRRICSPACVTMVLAHLGLDGNLARVAADCYHEPSHLFGVWPLALRAAARHGLVGAVEALDSIDTAEPFLAQGTPVVASIRFDAGALEGAALPRTDGHLVVVTGLAHDVVHVNDPASPSLADVPRSYARGAFANAWLTHRGASYLFCGAER